MPAAPQNSLRGAERLSAAGNAMDYLPMFLRLRGQAALVVGGGAVALRKAEWLVKAGARVSVIAPGFCAELELRATSGALECRSAAFEPAQLAGMSLVIAATDDAAVNAAVARAADERRIPVNVVDRPELSSFIFPAIIDRAPLLVAVSSAGHAPVLARQVREQIEALLPARLGALARFMGERRAAVRRALTAVARRPFWERIAAGITASRLLAGDEAGAHEAFRRELLAARLTSPAPGGAHGEVYLIGAGPGDPDLLTLRGLQLLQRADVILYDRLIPPAILERARRDAQRIFVGKQPGDHAQQAHIHELLVRLAREGKRVARLKGGDPLVFGRGGEELEVLAAHGIPCIVVPGITAALGAAAAAEIPLTHRHLARSVTFVSAQALLDEDPGWAALANRRHTVVCYMAVGQLPLLLKRLQAAGVDAALPAAIIERATLPEQRVLRAALGGLAELAARERIAPPALLILGEVTAAAATALPAAAAAAQQHTAGALA